MSSTSSVGAVVRPSAEVVAGADTAPVETKKAVEPAPEAAVQVELRDKQKREESSPEPENNEELARKLEDVFNFSSRKFSVSFSFDSESSVSFKVVDKKTGEVVREFPASSVSGILRKGSQGLILDGMA